MKRLISATLAVFITFCLLVGTERRAWGYVDPGSGLIAIQTLFSVGAAYVYFIRRKILSFFQRKKGSAVVIQIPSKTGDTREAA